MVGRLGKGDWVKWVVADTHGVKHIDASLSGNVNDPGKLVTGRLIRAVLVPFLF